MRFSIPTSFIPKLSENEKELTRHVTPCWQAIAAALAPFSFSTSHRQDLKVKYLKVSETSTFLKGV